MLLFQPDLGADAPLLPTLEAAQMLSDRVAVVDATRLGGLGATTCGLIPVGQVPDAALVNGRPGTDGYREPRAIDAAGGYVVRLIDGRPHVLLIFRRGVWDLPKGKRDDGESIRACAKREVGEEVGIGRLRIVRPLGTTMHGYELKKRYAVKTTYWFRMETDQITFTPQAEEDIEQVEWVAVSDAVERLGFPSLCEHARLVAPLLG
jgi:8-oxo-dGTP pyrophosphatase MutT (NUDIX family)